MAVAAPGGGCCPPRAPGWPQRRGSWLGVDARALAEVGGQPQPVPHAGRVKMLHAGIGAWRGGAGIWNTQHRRPHVGLSSLRVGLPAVCSMGTRAHVQTATA